MIAHCSSGNLFIVAAPSGGGKTSLVKNLVSTLENIAVSVSHTTRAARPGEKEGIDYFFINDQTFAKMIDDGAFLEYARVFNHYYGTSVTEINERLSAGIDVVLDIDWQGAAQIRHLFPDACTIFIVPPSLAILKQRLQNRRQDDEQVISKRMAEAQEEMSHFAEFDYLIVNDDFSNAAIELQAIVIADRMRVTRQAGKIGKLLSLLLTAQ